MAMMTLNLKPPRRELRQFALICLVGFALLGGVLRWRFGFQTAPVVLWILAPVVAGLGLAAPVAVKPLYVALMVAAFPIAWVVSHIMLGITYYGIITGIAVIFRLIGRDALGRKFDRRATTYWIQRRPTTDMSRYFRQF